ncbi:glycerophosphodiester phosphodiesterase family protein [Oceanotoga sp. DSM 15011]|uniref:glycerophosphodiester phosphodiesterase family protein n=1 Tax=Oceanotoga sp. DSM 15011 TaxID=2984951 RepID=UPI0021F3EE11|nr:glycerophosphodiester phosphodiesterase family protein [Oceanotoga sp. DSM 15011]UYO99344.1 glycerophosphodiester phosphodiesterase family protein [Oceanotoga sp. DSM 15011]
MRSIPILGHRGYRAKFTENTLEAFEKAIEFGADGIEYDTRLTKDKVPVVLHDDNLERLSGKNIKLSDITFEELQKIKLDNGQSVPKVEDVLKILDEPSFLNLEVKEVEAAIPSYELTKKYNALNRTLFSSFKVDALREIRKIDKDVKLGLLVDYDSLNNLIDLNKELNFFSLNLWVDKLNERKLISKAFLRKWRKSGMKIYLWTLNDPKDLKTFKGLYDGIITDEVELIIDSFDSL